MKRLLLIILLLMAGCIGSPTPHNPMSREGGQDSWWRASTIGVADKDNPWNAQIPVPPPVKDWTDPWNDFQEPKLFPGDWKKRQFMTTNEEQLFRALDLELENLKLKKAIKALLTPKAPKVEKSLFDRLKDLRKREKKFFDRSI